MNRPSTRVLQRALHHLLLLGAAYAASGAAAQAQNIDEGKTAPKLFAETCVNCHRSPNNLAKGRFRPTLFLFLQDHYTASSGAAWELSSYLAAVDTTGKRSKKNASSAAAHRTTNRPPAPVPSVR